MKEISGKQRREFCRAFLRTMDPQQAAEAAGAADGYALLEDEAVRGELRRMREAAAEEIRREDAIRQLARLAFGDSGASAETVLQAEGGRGEGVRLSAVSEIKRSGTGSVEIKFVDRIKALSTLCALLGSEASGEAETFFRALEEAGE